MGYAREKLSALALKRLSKKPGFYSDGGGLNLRVSSPTSASWVYRYMVDRRAREMGLGKFPYIGLADARALAAEARRLKALGRDPIAERRRGAGAPMFKECAARYIAAHRAGWRSPKQALHWEATLSTFAEPVIGSLPVDAIDNALILRILEPIWAVKPETAGRVRQRMEAVLDWATARGFREGANPARWRGHLDHMLPAKRKVRRPQHHPALAFEDIAAFMRDLRVQEGVAARALEFTILTAARRGEVVGATWAEIDVAARQWVVPASRMKSAREHRTPLSSPALAILRPLRREAGLVFPAGRARPISNMGMHRVLKRMGRSDIPVHGFRSTFRDWVAERTDFAGELAEMALAHAVGDKVEAAYRRGDLFEKRRRLMDAWAAYCERPPAVEGVVPLVAARA
jgi:integrase